MIKNSLENKHEHETKCTDGLNNNCAQTYVLLCVICTFVLYVNFQYLVVCNVFTLDCYQDYNEKHSNLSKLAGVKIQIHFKFCFIWHSRHTYKGKHFKADEKLFREYCVVNLNDLKLA